MNTDRNVPIWPFPGQSEGRWWENYPPHNLPPPAFSVGDRVVTRWGTATVLRVYDYEGFAGRAYQVRYDFSSAPPGFGHQWGENDMQPAPPPCADWDEPEEPAPAPVKVAAPQLELFA